MAKLLGICFTLGFLTLAFAQNPYGNDPRIPFEDLSADNPGSPRQERLSFGSSNVERTGSSARYANSRGKRTLSLFPGAPTDPEGGSGGETYTEAGGSDPARPRYRSLDEILASKTPRVREKFEQEAIREVEREAQKQVYVLTPEEVEEINKRQEQQEAEKEAADAAKEKYFRETYKEEAAKYKIKPKGWRRKKRSQNEGPSDAPN